MEGKYLLAYTVFGIKYNGFKSSYRHFDDLEKMKMFIKNHRVEDSCIVYQKNMELIKDLQEELKWD